MYYTKHLADASGPALFVAWVINQFIPVASPIIIFVGAVAGLGWYCIRYYEYFRNGRLGD